MKVVIQCAASKQASAGYMLNKQGNNICFVAQPELAPPVKGCVYVRPDDKADGGTWRALLADYNRRKTNPFKLLPAWRLYSNPAYAAFVEKLGLENVYILSAGWGLLKADFLTPSYDITFSPRADAWKVRSKKDAYADYNQLPPDSLDELVFFGGKEYLSLFCQLTNQYRGKRRVYYNSAVMPTAAGCEMVRFNTTTRTNWHYECVRKFLA